MANPASLVLVCKPRLRQRALKKSVRKKRVPQVWRRQESWM